MRHFASTLWIIGMCVLPLTSLEAQVVPEYEVEFLGASSSARAINDNGDCVGSYLPPVSGTYERAWVSIDGAPLELLPLPPGMSSSSATDINDFGQIVGSVGENFTAEVSFAATWIPNGSGGYDIELLGTLPNFTYSLAKAINNLGDIVGHATVPYTGGGWPVYFAPTGNVSLAEVYGFGYSCSDINESRQVIGGYDILDLETGILDGVPIAARAINESNQTAGSQVHSYVNPVSYDAVRHTPGVGIEIVTLVPSSFTFSYGINDLGDVVFEWPAGVYFDGVGSFDLDDLLAPTSSNWLITETSWDIDINNSRQIVAMGLNTATNDYGAVRLTPTNLATDEFVRGDVDGSGTLSIVDAIGTLNHLFVAAWIECRNAADTNDDESLDLSDAVYSLAALFASGPLPPTPYPGCGTDPTPGDLGCLTPPCP